MASQPTTHDPEPPDQRRSIGARRNPATEEAVLSAAEAILAEGGIAGFSIEAVARRARAGKPTIYRWWPDRTALLLAVYHRQKPPTVVTDTGSVEEDVTQYLMRLLNHWTGSAGEIFRFVIADAQVNPRTAETLRDYAEARRKQSAQIFRRGMDRGELAADTDPELAVEMLSGLTWQRLVTGRSGIAEPEARRIARQLVRGLCAPGA